MESTESPVFEAKPQTNEDDDYMLLMQANENFTNAEYDKCLDLLKQLQVKDESSALVLKHNSAVVHFYKSKCVAHAKLLNDLNELDLESLPMKHSLSSVMRYNKAVIYYHRHMYGTALEKLAPVVARLESMEKQMCIVVATLQLQLLLASNQLNRADAFLEYLHSKLNIVPAAAAASAATSASATNNTSTPVPTTSTAEEQPGMQPDSHNQVERANNSAIQLLNVLTHVVNRKPVGIPEDGSPAFAALKAHQYYIMKDFQMAAKQLMRINLESCQNGTNTSELNTCIANNMGVIHLRVRHYAIATKFFQNALNFDKHIADDLRETALQNLSSARSCEILYNLGIAMLHLRRPHEAFECFQIPLKFYHCNPRLWLRVSEACIMVEEMQRQVEEKGPMVWLTRTSGANKASEKKSTESAPTIQFAVLCLRNALTLTKYYKSTFHISNSEDSEETSRSWQDVYDNNFCNPSKPISIESLDNMLAAIYAAHSFVSLRLGDFVTALEMAQELLTFERLSDAHKLLAHMYAGQAQTLMNKPADARVHFDPTFVSTLNAFDFETKDWQVKSLDAAQNVVRYNLAMAMVFQKDYESARTILATLTHQIVANKAFKLRRYMDLRKL